MARRVHLFHVMALPPLSNEIISKQRTSIVWPTRSMRAEWIGRAYMSGSKPRFQSKLVSRWAIETDTKTWFVVSDRKSVDMRWTYSTAEEEYGECYKDKRNM